MAYIVYVLPNWGAFYTDMAGQFALPLNQSLDDVLFSMAVIPFASFVCLGAVAGSRNRPLVLPIVLGACCSLVRPFRLVMWYAIFEHLAFVILGLATIWLAKTLLNRRPRVMAAAITVLVLLLLGVFHRRGIIDGPRGYPDDLQWSGIVMPVPGVPYLTTNDVARVTAEVARHASNNTTTRVLFYPFGDSLFFADAWGPAVMPFYPRSTNIRPDLLVARTSRYLPGWQGYRIDRAFESVPDDLAPFHQRDQTERWYIVSLRPPDSK